MERHLSIVQSGDLMGQREKRILPRFPFSAMTFRPLSPEMIFQVDTLSPVGMRLQIKDGAHRLQPEDPVQGAVHWQGDEVQVQGVVSWVKGHHVGVNFQGTQKIGSFLAVPKIIRGLKALHLAAFDEERPPQLICWLKAAAVLEIFVWAHGDGEFEKIQVFFVDHFMEWQDGEGLQTGVVVEQENRDTPLFGQGECTIQMDSIADVGKLNSVAAIFEALPEDKVAIPIKEFILLKFTLRK